MTLATIAAALSAAFETRERINGDKFACLRDKSPEWMSDAIHAAHGDTMPDDTKYRMCERVADEIAELLSDDEDADLDDAKYERIDGLIPVYNRDRLDWLASALFRADYCDEAREEGTVSEESDMFARIAAGIEREYSEIWDALAEAIREQAEQEEAA